MGQEFVIKSTTLEDKINQLLPSQGGQQAGVDLSASTTIIPIVDLTESAEGSNLRQDLQTAVDFATTRTLIENATNTTIVNTTGFYQVHVDLAGVSSECSLNIFDGATSKQIRRYQIGGDYILLQDDLLVYLRAGDLLRGTSSTNTSSLNVFTRQIADVAGNLTNPLGF